MKPIESGMVILRDRKKREYMITLKEKGRFSSQYGFIEHAEIASVPAGSVLKSTGGGNFSRFFPSHTAIMLCTSSGRRR
ncbi:MAG: hypothetical protein LBD73_02225 [Deferribacteraceae bacterium]|nr:hypothetical protein [Deferribacteraceae bacterium]